MFCLFQIIKNTSTFELTNKKVLRIWYSFIQYLVNVNMKKSLRSLITGFILIIAFASCSTLKVVSDKDSSVDFSQYRTYQYYGWAKESNKILNALDQERIEKAFGKEFEKRGLKYVKDNGDLMVTLYIVTEKKTQTTANTTHMGVGMGYGYGGYYGYGPAYGWGASSSHTTYNQYDYTVGTLIIDVYDATGKKLIWEAIAKGTIDENLKNREVNINRAVGRMMLEYPVPAKKE